MSLSWWLGRGHTQQSKTIAGLKKKLLDRTVSPITLHPLQTHTVPASQQGAIEQEALDAALPCARDTDAISDSPVDRKNGSTAKGVSGQ